MTCPRCNNEWDVSKSPCPRCGLKVNLPTRSGVRPATPAARKIPQTPRPAQSLRPVNNVFVERQPTHGDSPPSQNSGAMRVPKTQQDRNQPSGFMPSIRRQQGNGVPTPQPNNTSVPRTPFPTRSPLGEQQQMRGQRSSLQSSQQALPILPVPDQQFEPPTSLSALPDTPRVSQSFTPDYDNNPFLSRLRRNEGSAETTPGNPGGNENIVARNVPHRPQAQPALDRSTENLLENQRSIRPSRLVTDALMRERQSLRTGVPNQSSLTPNPSNAYDATPEPLSVLVPGTLLRGGRYRLREARGRQDWRDGVYEASWIAQDAQRAGAQVMIRELVTPESKSMVIQSTLRNATMALTSVGRHPHIPTLWDAFSDRGRSFFVFEPIDGESLMGHMRRTGRAIPEQNMIECCLQMTEILELLAQQTPPLVHGLIRPEHIFIGRMGADYTLTNFSIVLAGGATQYVKDIDRASLNPYTAPDFERGMIDGRSDLYALMASVYHAVTGSMPIYNGGSIPQPRMLNPAVSYEFDAILTRGLHPNAGLRFQRPSELRQELLAMRSVNGTLSSRSGPLTISEVPKTDRSAAPRTIQPTIPTDSSLSQVLPTLLGVDELEDRPQKLLLPRPEELPDMPERNDARLALIWLIVIVVCLITVVIVSRGIL